MKLFTIIPISFSFGMAASIIRSEKEMIKIPIIADDIENTFHPYFDEKPIECLVWKIKLNQLSNVDEKWLKEHGGESLILTKNNIIIKINNILYESDKKYDIIENQDLTIYNNNILIFKTNYDNLKNMMSYADNEYELLYIPITIQFYKCKLIKNIK